MSTDAESGQSAMDFRKFLEFMFTMLDVAIKQHDNPKEFSQTVKHTVMTIIIVMIASSGELGILDEDDDVLGEGEVKGDAAVKNFLKDIYRAYTVLDAQSAEEDAQTSIG